MVEPAQETGVNCRECWANREWYREYIGESITEGLLGFGCLRGRTPCWERRIGRPKTFYMDEHCVSSEIPRKNLRFSPIWLEFDVGAKCCRKEGSTSIGHFSRNGKEAAALPQDTRGRPHLPFAC